MQYMVRLFNCDEFRYVEGFTCFYSSLKDAEDIALELAKKMVEEHKDIEVHVFYKELGSFKYQLIGYTSFDYDTWFVDSVEYEECFR